MAGVRIVCVGKVKEAFFRDGIAEYAREIRRRCPFEIVECADEATPENCPESVAARIKEREGERILQRIRPEEYVIALCIDGKHFSTGAWRAHMRRLRASGRDLVLVIGGSLGLSDAVTARANERLSFSARTFPHQLMRLILCEQLAKVL